MASQAPRKTVGERRVHDKKTVPGMKKKKEKPKKEKKEEEEEEENEAKPPPSNVIDGRVFEADRPLALSKEEEQEQEVFHKALKKYHKTSREMRKEALVAEKKDLKDAEKSPKDKHYEGTKLDRIKNIDMETDILENMEKLAEEKTNEEETVQT